MAGTGGPGTVDRDTPTACPLGLLVLLSATLITRDEEANIAACVRAAAAFADEVRVHDTGSTDTTVALAGAAGAIVTEGEWPDSFAQARNVPLAAAEGDWVLVVDADERALGDPAQLRQALTAAGPDVRAFTVDVRNLGADSYTSPGIRVFRRRGATWTGTAHEQVRHDWAGRVVALDPGVLSITHHGYATADVVRAKATRNVRLLERDLAAAGGNPSPALLLDLGRSYHGAGHTQQALDAFTLARDGGDTAVAAVATDHLARILLAAGAAELAADLAGELAGHASPAYVDWLVGTSLMHRGRVAQAVPLLGHDAPLRDAAGRSVSAQNRLELLALARALCGDVDGAWTAAGDAVEAGAVAADLLPALLAAIGTQEPAGQSAQRQDELTARGARSGG